jgi:hypothetical protein
MSADQNIVRDSGAYRFGHALRITCMTATRDIATTDDTE